MQKEIKELIDLKIQTLFDKPPKKKFDPILYFFITNQIYNLTYEQSKNKKIIIYKFYLNNC